MPRNRLPPGASGLVLPAPEADREDDDEEDRSLDAASIRSSPARPVEAAGAPRMVLVAEQQYCDMVGSLCFSVTQYYLISQIDQRRSEKGDLVRHWSLVFPAEWMLLIYLREVHFICEISAGSIHHVTSHGSEPR